MFEFRSFAFDAVTHRLTRSGEELHLTPKAFELLRLLIEAAPRAVDKTEIHQRLWPDQAVSDATLVGLIKEIRRTLDDNDREQRIIRTLHRVGYAFDAQLRVSGDSAVSGFLLILEAGRIALDDGENIVGRDAACDVWIDESTVSRRHARIVISTNAVALEDLGSKNGTRIGGRPLQDTTWLKDGDRISFGSVHAILRASTADRPTQTQLSIAD